MPAQTSHFVQLPPPYDSREAFIPAELPPPLTYSAELTALLSRADRALGGIAALADFVPDPGLFADPFLRLEAVSSSRIEGTQTSLQEVFRAESVEAVPADPDTREVVNYLKAMEAGVRRLSESGASFDTVLVRELHRLLLTDTRGSDKAPGRYREQTVWLGRRGRSIDYASYIPPPWDRIDELMEAWAAYARRCIARAPQAEAPPLVQCALLHAQFELIHPFQDGNGRLGRLLMSPFLTAAGCLSRPVLFLSAYFERHRGEYYDHLAAISEKGDWQSWVEFFLEGVEGQSHRALQVARAALALRDEWRSRLQDAHAPGYVLGLLDRLFQNPYTSVIRARGQLGVHFDTAKKAIGLLQDMGFLEELTGRKRHQQFCARQLLQQIEQVGQEAAAEVVNDE